MLASPKCNALLYLEWFEHIFVLMNRSAVFCQRHTLKDHTIGVAWFSHVTITFRHSESFSSFLRRPLFFLQLQYGIKLLLKLCNGVNIIYIHFNYCSADVSNLSARKPHDSPFHTVQKWMENQWRPGTVGKVLTKKSKIWKCS